MKVKTFHDAEARVVDHAAGTGKHKGRLGALVLELADGTRFNVGTGFSDLERESPPEIGSLVTFRYQELSDGGVPRFPSYVGVRIDASAPSKLAQAKVAPAPPAKKPEPVTSKSGARTFELVEGTSSKFWEITLAGSAFTTRYGKIGTNGQSTTKDFGTEESARREHDKLVLEKTKKGYVEKE